MYQQQGQLDKEEGSGIARPRAIEKHVGQAL